MESHWTQGQERLTGRAHVSNVGLEATCGEKHAQLASVVHITGASASPDGLARDACQIDRGLVSPDSCGVSLAGDPFIADANISVARSEIITPELADANILSSRINLERLISKGRIGTARVVVQLRIDSNGSVDFACRVVSQCLVTNRGVVETCVVHQRLRT